MKVTEDVLEFLDLKLTFDKDYKLRSADFIAKATHSFTYVLSSICFSKNSIENIPKAVVLRLRRSCDSDDQSEENSVQHRKYFVARDVGNFLMQEIFQGRKLEDLK